MPTATFTHASVRSHYSFFNDLLNLQPKNQTPFMKMKLKEIVEREDTAAGRWFNLIIIILILLSVLSLSVKRCQVWMISLSTYLKFLRL